MDLRKLKDKATEAFGKGRFAKAAELYAEYCSKDPRDHQARLRMGDAWAKSGNRAKAVDAYKAAAEGFAKEGFLPRAIAASKLVVELDPGHKGVQQMLADLYAQKGGPPPRRRGATPTGSEAPSPDNRRNAIEAPEARPPAAPMKTGRVFGLESLDASAPGEILEVVDRPLRPPSPELEVPIAGRQGGTDVSGAIDLSAELPPELAGPGVLTPAAAASGGNSPPSTVTPAALRAPASKSPSPPAHPLPGLAGPLAPAARGPQVAPPPPPAAVAEEAVEPVEVLDIGELSLGEPIPGLTPATLVEERRPSQPGPPGLRRRSTAEVELEVEVEVEVPAASPVQGAPGSDGAAFRRAPAELQSPGGSRIWMPSAGPAPAALMTSGADAPAATPGARPRITDVERGMAVFSRFSELELDLEQATALAAASVGDPAPLAGPAQGGRPTGVPSFPPLGLAGDSLLHAVESAARAGLMQRGQVAEGTDQEELLEAPDDLAPERAVPGVLPHIPLFSDLPPDAFIELFERCPLRRLGPTEVVFEQGSQANSFFVICEGSVRVVRQNGFERIALAELKEGAFFGEMALLSGAPRSASVESTAEETQLLEISAQVLAELSHRFPQVAQALKKFCRQRLLSNVLNTSALFKPFSRSDRRDLVERFRAREVNKGEVLIREGARSDGMYVVLSGEVEVKKGEQRLATLREGELFGEMSLLQKTPATASVTALRRTSLLRLPREDFDQLILSHPQVLMLVAELTDERKRRTDAALGKEAMI